MTLPLGEHLVESPTVKEFRLENEGKSALMKVEWGGRILTIRQHYKVQKSEGDARASLDKTVAKMLALADVYAIGKPNSKTKSVTVAGKTLTQKLDNGQVKTKEEFQAYLQQKLEKKSSVTGTPEDVNLAQQINNIRRALDLFNKSITLLPVSVERSSSNASVPPASTPNLATVLKDLDEHLTKGDYVEDPRSYLKSKPEGTFIIQPSKMHEGCYTLYAHQINDPKTPNINFIHRVLEPTPNGIILKEQPQPGRVFSNVEEVIKFLKLDPSNQVAETAVWKPIPKKGGVGDSGKKFFGVKPAKDSPPVSSPVSTPIMSPAGKRLGASGLSEVAEQLGAPPPPPKKDAGPKGHSRLSEVAEQMGAPPSPPKKVAGPKGYTGMAAAAGKIRPPPPPPKKDGPSASEWIAGAPGPKKLVHGVLAGSKLTPAIEEQLDELLSDEENEDAGSHVSEAAGSRSVSALSNLQNAAQLFDDISSAINKFKREFPANKEQNIESIQNILLRLAAATEVLNNRDLVGLKEKLDQMRAAMKEGSTELNKLEKYMDIEVIEDANAFLEKLERKRKDLIKIGGNVGNLKDAFSNLAVDIENEYKIITHPLFKEKISSEDRVRFEVFTKKTQDLLVKIKHFNNMIDIYTKGLNFSDQMKKLNYDSLEDSLALILNAMENEFPNIGQGMEKIFYDAQEIAEIIASNPEFKTVCNEINIKDRSGGTQQVDPITRLIQIPHRYMDLYIKEFSKITQGTEDLKERDALIYAATHAQEVTLPYLKKVTTMKTNMDLRKLISMGEQLIPPEGGKKKGSDKKLKELEATYYHLLTELEPLLYTPYKTVKGNDMISEQVEFIDRALIVNEKIRQSRFLKLLKDIDDKPEDATLRKELEKHIGQMDFAFQHPALLKSPTERNSLEGLIKQGSFIDVPSKYIDLFRVMKVRYDDQHHGHVMSKRKDSNTLREVGLLVDAHIKEMEKAVENYSKKPRYAKSLADLNKFLSHAKAEKAHIERESQK